jgi:hypothetical protein
MSASGFNILTSQSQPELKRTVTFWDNDFAMRNTKPGQRLKVATREYD